MSLNDYRRDFLYVLRRYIPYDDLEAAHHEKTLAFVKEQEHPFDRSNMAGHITASAVVVDEKRTVLALVWHAKIGAWFQPGGHCEVRRDRTVPLAAERELIEELAVHHDMVFLLQSAPFDIDVHQIPATVDEPSHPHYDIRYLFQLPKHQLPISDLRKWVAIEDVAAWDDPSQARFAQKLWQKDK